jgi:hydroxymethylpyrimidine pyrophosphatase-like HAD family hydrolase/energy-coupling factor transporter ATP-binding protein EcfA2
MHMMAVATDYDGTIAKHGRVAQSTITAIKNLIASGRKLVLVTGRMLPDLLAVFPEAVLCSRIVAENGAVLYRPDTRDQKLSGAPPPESFVESLKKKKVPLDVGASILATVKPHEMAVLETIRDLGLEHHIVFNREAVMILPPGVNKGTGLKEALLELQLSSHNVVGIGDSENDHALLQACEYAVAVADALPMLKSIADWVTRGDDGEGVTELLAELITNDLASVSTPSKRHSIVLGSLENGATVSIPPLGANLLIAGSSGSGKSTLANGFLERLAHQQYQYCVIDPEGDYESFENAIVFGNAQRGPAVSEVLTALENPSAQIVITLVGVPLKDRPAFFLHLLPRLQEWRAKTGRPHRIFVDEAHHLLPPEWQPAPVVWAEKLDGMVFITVHPDQVSTQVLRTIDMAVALGDAPERTLQSYADRVGLAFPNESFRPSGLSPGKALVWKPASGVGPETMQIASTEGEQRRHRRKYAEGELPPDRSFYFRGPHGLLNLRAQNLILFRQVADGVDDATWLYHLREGDYSRWMETAIKDQLLVEVVRRIEQECSLTAQESRQRIAHAIEERYTLPATGM